MGNKVGPRYRAGQLITTGASPVLILDAYEFMPGWGYAYDVLRRGKIFERVIEGNIHAITQEDCREFYEKNYWYDEV